jgi:hypothetical protein
VGYPDDIRLAARWIAQQQDKHDGGWGLVANQASSLVNTAEAVDVLQEAGGYEEACERGISFLVANTFQHAQPRLTKDSAARGARIRYVAFPLLVLALHDRRHAAFIEKCKAWLLRSRNDDCGWGDEANDQASKLFPTFLALRALQEAGATEQELEHSYTWVRAQSKPDGWSLYPEHPISAVATAYGILCLTKSRFRNDERVERGGKFLLQTKAWHPTTDDASGTVWQHATCTWVICALAELDETPYSPTIAEGIRYINTLKRSGGAPWAETPDHHALSTRSQYWAVVALRALQRSFDPSIHSIRIDAERATEELKEPTYLKFKVRSSWAVIIPAKMYQFATYLCFFVALLFAFSFHRALPSFSKEMDMIVAILLLLLGWKLLRIRRKAFSPRVKTFLTWIVGAAVFAGAWFGKDGYTILSGAVEFTRTYTEIIWNYIKSGYYAFIKAPQ